MIDPTPQNVIDFWQFMHNAFGTSTIKKDDALEMQIVAELLDTLGITDKGKFLESFTTTIGTKIYTPFTIGVETEKHSLWHQMVICVHEHQHVIQSKNETLFELNYLRSESERTKYEIEAYRCNLEMNAWRYKMKVDSHDLANVLSNYGVGVEDIKVAAKAFSLMCVSINQGIVSSESMIKALEWLNANVSQIRSV